MDYLFLQNPKNPIFGVLLGITPKLEFFPKIQLRQFFTLKAP